MFKLNNKNTAAQEEAFFGQWLMSQKLITSAQLEQALTKQKESSERLGQILIQLGALNDLEVTQALGRFLSMPVATLDDLTEIDPNICRQIPENIAKRFCLIPISEKDESVVVAMADPLNIVATDTVAVKLKRRVEPVIAPEQHILKAIEQLYHGSDVDQQQMRDLVDLEISNDDEPGGFEDIDDEESIDSVDADDAPVIRFVDLMLSHAIKSRASDIHIEPQEKSMTVRMRVDGILVEMVPPARKMQPAVIARIKIISDMDIAERRLPQDGRFKIKRGKDAEDIDVRVSVLPTIYGEKIVMRILDKTAVNHNLNKIGLDEKTLKRFKTTLHQPHGIIIVTGPTGSGKSTTLYSALNELRDPRKNITTVEDPVEYRMGGINQTQIKPEIGLTFASCLRSILRQDPDIILIGEIRDRETMEIAIKASLTGHLVLSTFHTNDAPSAISRLVYMGLEPYLLASSLNLILAQRLVRRVCENCAEPTTLSDELIERLRLTPEMLEHATILAGKGCAHCNGTGYRGRTPIFEMLPVDTEIRDIVAAGQSESKVRALARQKGYADLVASGIDRLLSGQTTAEEVLRVTFTEEANG